MREEHIRAFAEHAAGFLQGPPTGSNTHFDVAGLPVARRVAALGQTRFAFTRGAHREIRFADESELLEFVSRLFHELAGRSRPTTREEVREYVRGRLLHADVDWTLFEAGTAKGSEWARFCRS